MPNPEIETIVLRFRDLVTPAGGTIDLHRRLAESRDQGAAGAGGPGTVWWGWWSKSRERIADEALRTVLGRIKASTDGDGLLIYLLDSGQRRLYSARLHDIEWERSHERRASPDPAATPLYYRDQHYPVWFQLSDLAAEPVEPSVLEGFSYVSPSGGDPFDGKRVHSLRELVQQEKTLWFLRPFRPEDPSHEISLLSAARAVPDDFPPEYRQSESRQILWVSDLHYAADGHHGFPIEPSAHLNPVGPSIGLALTDRGIRPLAGVIVSGDLTWRGEADEYRQAHGFLDWARSFGEIDNDDIVLCPGNHDLVFSGDPADKSLPVTETDEESRRAWSDFYRQLHYKGPNEFLSCGRRFLLGGSVAVEVACLNSSLLAQHSGLFQGHGFVGDEQLRDAAIRMGWKSTSPGAPRAFRIVVLHHHLLPVTFREEPRLGALYSVVLDAEALCRWLARHRVDLVLHGHMHQPFASRLSRPVEVDHPEGDWHSFYVVGMGSTGVRQDHLGEVGKNVFGLLSFEGEGVDVQMHTLSPSTPSEELWRLRVPYPSERCSDGPETSRGGGRRT